MASASAVDTAVLAVLKSDTALAALLPDGVWIGTAGRDSRRFVLVQQLDHIDDAMFGGTAYERFVYLVRAFALATDAVVVSGGADRIHALLHRQPLSVTGYTHMGTLRIGHQGDDPELDPVDTDLRFQHRGGQYEVFVSPT
jgi:hypothetical protein